MVLKSLTELSEKIKTLETEKEASEISINELTHRVEAIKSQLYQANEQKLHLAEIVRLAAHHFPRLRNQKELTDADYAELEKWVRRAKSVDGLKSIVAALQEIGKYERYDIKSNLYGLVQKIIIEGPKAGPK
jgi:chromosome segregation ATPase